MAAKLGHGDLALLIFAVRSARSWRTAACAAGRSR